MPVVEFVRRVRFPVSAIWPVLSDVVGFGEMSPDLLRCEVTQSGGGGDGSGVGMVRRCHDKSHRRWNEQCTAWDEGHGYTMAVTDGNYPYPFRAMRTRLSLTQQGDVAQISVAYEYRPAFAPIGYLLNKFWQRHYLEPIGNGLLDELTRRVRDRVWLYTITADTILTDKGRCVVSVNPQTSIADTVALLADKGIGAVMVLSDQGEIAGIASERDIVMALPAGGGALLQQPVSQIMTKRVIVCAPEDDMASVMACMTGKRIRHLPVVVDDRLVGIISIGDVVKARMAHMEAESESMREYIASREWREQYIHGAAGDANPFPSV